MVNDRYLIKIVFIYFILGCAWLFGIIVLIEPNFFHQLIFCLCNSFQGFFIFLFHVYLSKPKRELWQIFFIQRRLYKNSHVSSGHTDLMTISNSNGGITRPVKFRFSSISLNNKLQNQEVLLEQTKHEKKNSYA